MSLRCLADTRQYEQLKNRPSSMINTQWNWDLNAQLWIFCTGLTIVLLSSILVVKRRKANGCVWGGWLSTRQGNLDEASLTKVEKQERLVKTQLESNHKEETISFVPDYPSDEKVQRLQQTQQEEVSMALDKHAKESELTPEEELAQSTSSLDDKPYMDLEGENDLPNDNDNDDFGYGTRPMLESYAHAHSIRKSNIAGCSSEESRNIYDCTTFYPRSLPKLMPTTYADVRRNKDVTAKFQHPEDLVDISTNSCKEITAAQSSTYALVPKKDETTQTNEKDAAHTWAIVSLSKGTMTDPYCADSSVSTHGALCKLVRHHSTSTSGPFMKKLRRAHRLLAEARKTSRCDQASSTVKWRKVLNRYKHKMQSLTIHLAKRDEMMGGTSLRITVLRGEIKDALLAVRSTKERLTTQCKLNSALMDVVESKSDNPTYGTDL